MKNLPIWPEYLTRHAIIDDPSYDLYKFHVQVSCYVRFAEKGIYYLVEHTENYELVIRSPTDQQDIADKILNAQKEVTEQLVRHVEVSKMMLIVDPLLHDHEGNPLHWIDEDQTPENERLMNKYLPQHQEV